MLARAKKVSERLCRPVLKYLAPGGIILGYHRISETTWDPLNLAISKQNFQSQLDIISAKYCAVSIGSLLALKQRGETLKGYVVITFDDGCEEFIRYAVPELVARNIPATVFIMTGCAGEAFWWDEVSQLLNSANLEIDDLEIEFCEGDGKQVFGNLANEESVGNAVRDICDRLLILEPSRRSEVIGQIRRQTADDHPPACAPRAMTQEQLQRLSEISLIEIAAHSVTHPLLSRLDSAEQKREIEDSRSALEALGIAVKGFSYPNGSYSRRTCEIVKESGFDYACTSHQSAVRRRSDCYQLPRIWVPNTGGENFRRWLSAWSGI